jgi:alpha-L-rhamnosidase
MGVPEERRAAVVETLRAELQETYRNHLNTGMLATRYLFEVLARNGLNDLACDLLLQRDFPSFGWWLEQGATTTWEQWNGRDSHDHPMFGGGLTWLHKCLAGVDIDPEEPGFRHILIRPYLAAKVGDVRYQTVSPYGKVGAEVHHDSTSVRVKVTVPAGCHATVFVPGETAPHEVAQGTWTFTADKVAE